MFRKTLTIFSLIGLLLSVGLWCVSYYVPKIPRQRESTFEGWGFGIYRGEFQVFCIPLQRVPSGRGVLFDLSFDLSIGTLFFSVVIVCIFLPSARRIMRKTITIASLAGLLFCVGLWIFSYVGMTRWVSGRYRTDVGSGRLHVKRTADLSRVAINAQYPYGRPGIRIHGLGYHGLRTVWLPDHHWGISAAHVNPPTTYVEGELPLWIPTLGFGTLFAGLYIPVRRRRKRIKLGLCLNCGYDLRGSSERCPECGRLFT